MSEWTTLHSDFSFVREKQSFATSCLIFLEKSRLAHLLLVNVLTGGAGTATILRVCVYSAKYLFE